MSWSKRIRIVFDGKLYNVTPLLKDYFRLVEAIYGTYIYPISVGYGANDHELYLEFADFYRAVQPLSLEYLGGTSFGGKDIELDPFSLIPNLSNINPSDSDEYLSVYSIIVIGEIKASEPSKIYSDEHLQVNTITAIGVNLLATFTKGYLNDDYLQVNAITMTGQYCDINGVPL